MKIIVAGRPRSGTSLMMRLLDLSGYSCIRDMEWEKSLKSRSNPYFYESKDFIHTGNIKHLKEFDAGKVMIGSIENLDPQKVKLIWMDRNKESIIKSQKSYNRLSMIKASSYDEDFYSHDEKEIIKKYDHIVVKYEKLISDPDHTLLFINEFVPLDNFDKLKKEINPKLKHY